MFFDKFRKKAVKEDNNSKLGHSILTFTGHSEEADPFEIGVYDPNHSNGIRPVYKFEKVELKDLKDFLNQLAKDAYHIYYINFTLDKDSKMWVPIHKDYSSGIEKLNGSASLDIIINKINEIVDYLDKLEGN